MTAVPSDLELGRLFEEDQTRHQAQESARIPLGVVGVSAILAYGAWSVGHGTIGFIWFALVTALLLWRTAVSQYYFSGMLSSWRMSQWWLRFCVMNGVAFGGGTLIFMQWFSPHWQALTTIFVLAFVAGAVATTAFSTRHYRAYAVPLIALFSLGWAFFGHTDPRELSWFIAMLCPVYLVVFMYFVKHSESNARAGFKMRFESERLLEQVKAKQIEVIRERDIAQKANRAKSRFLASASHDLRQPLQTISMYYAALSLRPLDATSSELVSRAGTAITSLTSLLNALLDVSQLDTAAIKARIVDVNLQKLVARIQHEFKELALHRSVNFEAHIPDGLSVRADPILLERILRNLLDNALKHGARTHAELEARAIDASTVEITVRDDGDGIPEDEHESIFEEFYQRHNPERDRAQGLGLGLPIVRRLSALCNGSCRVESRPGDTRFVTRFPRAADADQSRSDRHHLKTESSWLRGARILVVDDESEVRASLAALLKGLGCIVDVAGEVEETSQMLARHSYMALLIDYRLRNGYTGLRYITEHRDLLGSVATIMITGDASSVITEQAEALDVPVMRKPIDPVELRRTLEDIASPE